MNNHILTPFQKPIKNGQRQSVVGFVVLTGFGQGNEVEGVDVHDGISGSLMVPLSIFFNQKG